MIIEFDEYKSKLNGIKPNLEGLGRALKLDDTRAEIASLEAESAKEGFWNDVNNSQKVQKRLKQLQNKVAKYEKLCAQWDDLMTICDMAIEENDDSMLDELKSGYAEFEETLESMRLSTLLSGEYDANNAILTIHPGAGGTEAQDWAQMLYRMYTRWAERHGYKYTILDYLDGEEAGIKSATIKVSGKYAFGYAKAEKGVHRLVRISPFDAAKRRHTSFASVDVMPELDDSVQIDIDPSDLRVDTFRSSGAGGQHINKTESAVRITHLPTGIVVASQAERSQLQNRQTAMSMLKSKLYELEEEKQAKQRAEIEGVQLDIGWGSQIRSYVFQPYTMVKDNRSGYETHDVQGVMDGDLDPFINAYLQWRLSKKNPR